MTDTLFTVLGLPVTGFGLGMAGALLVALGVELAWCKARGVSYGVFIRFAALAVPLTLLCSRLLFVLAGKHLLPHHPVQPGAGPTLLGRGLFPGGGAAGHAPGGPGPRRSCCARPGGC